MENYLLGQDSSVLKSRNLGDGLRGTSPTGRATTDGAPKKESTHPSLRSGSISTAAFLMADSRWLLLVLQPLPGRQAIQNELLYQRTQHAFAGSYGEVLEDQVRATVRLRVVQV